MNTTTEISAVIFDMDGLMLDTETIERQAWQRAAADWGYRLQDDVYLQTVGRKAQDTKKILVEAFGKGFPFQEVQARKKSHFQAHATAHGIPVKPGLKELLALIDELQLLKAVASSSRTETVIHRLTMTQLIQIGFDAIVGGDEVENGKPAPDIFLATTKKLDVPAEQCLVLEDSEHGIRGAHAAGMTPIMIPDLKPPTTETARLAYRIFPSLHEVRDFLRELSSPVVRDG